MLVLVLEEQGRVCTCRMMYVRVRIDWLVGLVGFLDVLRVMYRLAPKSPSKQEWRRAERERYETGRINLQQAAEEGAAKKKKKKKKKK